MEFGGLNLQAMIMTNLNSGPSAMRTPTRPPPAASAVGSGASLSGPRGPLVASSPEASPVHTGAEVPERGRGRGRGRGRNANRARGRGAGAGGQGHDFFWVQL